MVTATISGVVDGSPNCSKNFRPPIVNFDPSMWGDTFASQSVDEQLQETYIVAIESMKEEARKMLISQGSTKFDKLVLIDTLEHLGIAYHFEKEIEEQLKLIFRLYSDSKRGGNGMEANANDNLFSVALEFRLLRQHRYDVSCGIFDKFMKEDSRFNEAISSDAEGLMSLYEAAQARIHGEGSLDEAVDYATYHLNRMLPHLESPLQDKVKRALEQSLHRGVPIIEARYFISIYEKDNKKDDLLLKFAKLNFNFLQNMYRKELCEITRWWNEFDLKSKLPYMRDRLVECYFWGVAHHFEPQYAFVRLAVCKTMKLVTVLDDTYDNYATIEEGQLFTKILDKWDIDEIDQLPEYMKIVYRFVWSTYEDLQLDALKRERSFMIPYAIESVKQLGRAYLKELEWFNGRKLPTFEDYFTNTVITSAIQIMFIPCFIGMTSASIETVQWLINVPEIVVATDKVVRHAEDVGSWERESRGQMPTGVDCYMKQHSVSREETLAKFIRQAEVGWKDVNTERLKIPASIPKDVVHMFLNYTRVAEITYKNCEDGYTYPEKNLAPHIAALLIDPIVI